MAQPMGTNYGSQSPGVLTWQLVGKAVKEKTFI